MKRNDQNWKPSRRSAEILNIAMEHVKSVPYKVSLRWLFYRLLQEGIYKTKDDYQNKCKDLFSRARHTFYNGWAPDTLADETRNIIWRGIGSLDENEAIDDIKCNLDKFSNQDHFLMLLYEANAMTGQFEEYTSNIPLIPFGGDPSLPYKWETTMAVNGASKRYQKPIILLYFGDCDEKGEKIHETAITDIRRWCPVDFEIIICGLTLEQAKQYKIPENPEKPGEYQWEALTDEHAEKIITKYVSKYQNLDKIKELEKEEKEMVEKWKDTLEGELDE